MTSSVAAQFGGTGTSFLNRYFLPQGAQVSGTSGLIFGVLAPFGIVTIILYVGLSKVIEKRQAQGLSALLALFIIPSGGYKVISNTLIVIFGLGTTGTVPSVNIPFLGGLQMPGPPVMAAIISFFIFAGILGSNIIGRDQFQLWEYLASAIGAFLVWASVGGALGFIEAVGWVFFLWIAYEIFESGMEARRREGFLVGVIGLFLFFSVLSGMELLPDELQRMAGAVSGLGLAVILIFLGIIALAIFLILDRFLWQNLPWNPIP